LSTDVWKSYNNEDFLGDGLNIGRFYDGNVKFKWVDVYVGRGIYHGSEPTVNLTYTQQAPGRIQVVPNKGFNMVIRFYERYISSNAEYLSIPQGCSCTFERCNKCTSMPYAVQVPSLDGSGNFWISKEVIPFPSGIPCENNATSCNYVSVGKVLNSQSQVWYANAGGVEESRRDGVYDILTCRKMVPTIG
jgi:hypothetical protein